MFIQQTLPIMLCLVKFHPSSVHLSLKDDKEMRRKETGWSKLNKYIHWLVFWVDKEAVVLDLMSTNLFLDKYVWIILTLYAYLFLYRKMLQPIENYHRFKRYEIPIRIKFFICRKILFHFYYYSPQESNFLMIVWRLSYFVLKFLNLIKISLV